VMMAYDAARYSDAVTFALLIDRGMDVGLHCLWCGRPVVVKVSSLPFAVETPVPACAGRSSRYQHDGSCGT
jgi:hypothetical protein